MITIEKNIEKVNGPMDPKTENAENSNRRSGAHTQKRKSDPKEKVQRPNYLLRLL
ncbi:hypothetical protein [Pedobacter metabolipauper]|uniref:Uncharacterized protein n=1 Tax=Pedobacter metabolipauper TaxID=425513 RepID=A0A4R6SXT0_9SPHI|nr:hypothetical protein [Pedobacter metabolipauper]TDQ10023.1 hypothetical protein ATK78_2182 [Pedobacter metabolipauper]